MFGLPAAEHQIKAVNLQPWDCRTWWMEQGSCHCKYPTCNRLFTPMGKKLNIFRCFLPENIWIGPGRAKFCSPLADGAIKLASLSLSRHGSTSTPEIQQEPMSIFKLSELWTRQSTARRLRDCKGCLKAACVTLRIPSQLSVDYLLFSYSATNSIWRTGHLASSCCGTHTQSHANSLTDIIPFKYTHTYGHI